MTDDDKSRLVILECLLEELVRLKSSPDRLHAPKLEEKYRLRLRSFLLSQKPLESDFAKVLHENLWELYARQTNPTKE